MNWDRGRSVLLAHDSEKAEIKYLEQIATHSSSFESQQVT